MKSILKYFIIFPILLISFSCDETVTDSTVHNGDIVGSWMMTGLTGVYTYVIDFPGSESGVTYTDNASFGIKLRWEHADLLVGNETTTDQWVAEFKEDSVSLYKNVPYDLATMAAADFGLIGVFHDAPSAGADATYYMKGTYPGIFYNYSLCSSAGSTAPMTDQGLYTWDQASYNFTIKRDPSIAGSQVLPTFDDGALTMVNDTTLNIQFLDRDSHSELYTQIMDTWNEGTHPDATYGGNGENSGGDRTYMAFPDSLAVNAANMFVGLYEGDEGTTKTDNGYVYDPTPLSGGGKLEPWGFYYTWNAYVYGAESAGLKTNSALDSDGDGTVSDAEVIGFMLQNPDTQCFGGAMAGAPTYSDIVIPIVDAPNYQFVNDSSTDYKPLEGDNDGGKMTFNVVSDCAAPVDVTIQFDATFTRCTTDNCTGDGYHVTPTWD